MQRPIHVFIAGTAILLALLLGVQVGMAGGPARAPVASSTGDASYLWDFANTKYYSVGQNKFGQLGNGTASSGATGDLQTLSYTSGDVFYVGAEHMVVMNAGTLKAWGSNRYGQLGVATNAGTPIANTSPITVALPAGAVASVVVLGRQNTFVVDTAGRLWSWGYNMYGELGHPVNVGTESELHTPTQVDRRDSVIRWTAVYPGGYHTVVCGVSITGTSHYYAFGLNQFGQLGVQNNVGTMSANSTPIEIAIPPNVARVSLGEYHTLVTVSETASEIYACGSNLYGQLGVSTNSGTSTPNYVAAKIPRPPGVTSWIGYAGGNHSAALSTTDLYTWGSNMYGQLGYATNAGTALPNPAPGLVARINNNDVVQVAAGYRHTVFGIGASPYEYYACGSNEFGQLANPTHIATSTATSTPVPFGTPVSVRYEPTVVREFTLNQNYPNPFNPSTTIRYKLPQALDVRLAVYDDLGREVLLLVDAHQQPGEYILTFDAASLPSGAYFYTIRAGGFTQTKKMMLVK